jgi:flavin reductase (DIM6/NTAB) family NADH-FMN oxidoreductase RutF
MIENFKDLMAKIPSCVGVIVFESDSEIGACTVSSFVSISVEKGNEAIIFTLKPSSHTGREIKSLKNFSISILMSDQGEIAKLAGSSSTKNEFQAILSSKVERNQDDVLVMRGASMTFVLKFSEAYRMGNSEVYVCQVLSGEQNSITDNLPMVYFDRRFTTVQRVNQ